MANQFTKFEVSSFSQSGDILGETKNLNWSPISLLALAIIKLCTRLPITQQRK